MWKEGDDSTCLEDLAVRRRARAREREPDSTILALKQVHATKTSGIKAGYEAGNPYVEGLFGLICLCN